MHGNDSIERMIDQMIASDEQPSEKLMAEMRKRLQHKVVQMKRRGHYALYLCLVAVVVMLLGFVVIVIAVNGQQDLTWLARLGFGTVIIGAVLALFGCLGLLMFRGFGFVWARHDFQEAAISELSLQVERLSEQLDKLSGGA